MASLISRFVGYLEILKFHTKTALMISMLLMVYTVTRTHHYMYTVMHYDNTVAWISAAGLELIIIACGGIVIAALYADYNAELNKIDRGRTIAFCVIGWLGLLLSFIGLGGLAYADAFQVTDNFWLASIGCLFQLGQMIIIIGFVLLADIDQREAIRSERKRKEKAARDEKLLKKTLNPPKTRPCVWCSLPMPLNNVKRHENSCCKNPKNQ